MRNCKLSIFIRVPDTDDWTPPNRQAMLDEFSNSNGDLTEAEFIE